MSTAPSPRPAHFNIKPKPWAPFDIIFGNSNFQYTNYADLGPILGRDAIVDHAPDKLISIAKLSERH